MEAPAAGARVARIQNEPSSSQRERACNRVRRIKSKHVEASRVNPRLLAHDSDVCPEEGRDK
jgi:hypothetical protein